MVYRLLNLREGVEAILQTVNTVSQGVTNGGRALEQRQEGLYWDTIIPALDATL
ncbi:MAG: hypothetical protein Q9173_001226, partial [Seirophora scorigena]